MKSNKAIDSPAAPLHDLSQYEWAEDEFPLPYEQSKHEREILKYFSDLRSGSSSDFSIVPSVFLCFTNRCGSNFVAEQLASTGKLPRARESFNWPAVLKFSQRTGAKSFHHFCQLLVQHHSRNGIFASKIGWAQLYFLCRSKAIPEVFGIPHFIHVRRRDLLAQAISFVIAKQTGAWSSKHVPQAEPHYDADAIANRMERIAYGNAKFEILFARFGFPRIEIIYEDFLAQNAQGVSAITEWLGLGPSCVDASKTRLHIQRSSVNEEWKARFLSEQREFFGGNQQFHLQDANKPHAEQ